MSRNQPTDRWRTCAVNDALFSAYTKANTYNSLNRNHKRAVQQLRYLAQDFGCGAVLTEIATSIF